MDHVFLTLHLNVGKYDILLVVDYFKLYIFPLNPKTYLLIHRNSSRVSSLTNSRSSHILNALCFKKLKFVPFKGILTPLSYSLGAFKNQTIPTTVFAF